MINSEKDLEDYICENQEEFIDTLKTILGIDETINFIGRQIKLGNENICDLLYEFEYNEKDKNFIIVELKFRELETKDLAQISRYISILNDKLEMKDEFGIGATIYGVFVSFGLSREMKEVESAHLLDFIYYIKIKQKLYYEEEKYSKNPEYIEKIELDERIEKIYATRNDNGS